MNKKGFTSGFSVVTIVLLIFLGLFLLLLGVGNLIRPDVPDSSLDQNRIVCLMVILTGLTSIYAILRPFSGGIGLCFCGLLFFVIYIMNPIAVPVIGLSMLSIGRSRALSQPSILNEEAHAMTCIEQSVIIPAHVEEVFRYAADYRTWTDWFEGVSDFKATSAVSQGNGARYAYKVRLMDVSAGVETEIHDFVHNCGWTGVATKGMPHRTHWVFEAAGEGTTFTYTLEYQLPIPLLGSRIDSLLMKPQWEKIIEKSLNNLRRHFLSRSDGPAR